MSEVRYYDPIVCRRDLPDEWPPWLVRLCAMRYWRSDGEVMLPAVPNPELLLAIMRREGLVVIDKDGTRWEPTTR